ncbi:Serine/threonine-protein kinase [Xylona heveae TC161]|uniref:non-specific serine/threonine protein kinase n=1 Tax=Xylona heveae (strain CBS 132557 / TC161) TaxID=1328760 RepID=A0A165GUB7_XYLHT|nr:Serine/threonine-protein kinase [Xylona heveae TC161]KZF22607.1 Serine/threonine-protein kinase [Xylona heveae TC161]
MPPPTTPWKKTASQNHGRDHGFPELGKSPGKAQTMPAVSMSPLAPVHLDYSETQNDEIEALRSIYMEDYEDVKSKAAAWSKSADRSFKLHLKSKADPSIQVDLAVTMTATYPKSLPILSIERAQGVRRKPLALIEDTIRDLPKSLLGSEMIYEIAVSIEETLEDAAQSKAGEIDMPSLEEERAVQEAATSKLAQEHEEALRRKKREENLEEERVLGQMLEEEMKRRKDKARDAKRKSRPAGAELARPEDMQTDRPRLLSFDRLSSVKDDDGNIIAFRTVVKMASLHRGCVTEVVTVRPHTAGDSEQAPILILKQARLKPSFTDPAGLKRQVRALEDELERLKSLRHSNVLDLLDFKISSCFDTGLSEPAGTWEISILTEYANKGSLNDLLEIVGSLGPDIVRAFAIQLLEGLDFYHRNGVVHRDLHAGNVMLIRPSSGSTIIKLADASYQKALHDLRDCEDVTFSIGNSKSAYWLSPELGQETNAPRTRKTDIWDLGIIFLQMLFGLSVVQKYASPSALMDTLDLSETLLDFIRKFFKADPKKRSSAFDLLPCEFLRNDAPILASHGSQPSSRLSSTVSLPTRRLSRNRHDSSGLGAALSRYANDFVEAGRLGKGGFGEVVKARNKLDGRFYAIKKITQQSTSSLTGVLSEIMLLSRLNHPYVVRYFTAWMEEDFSALGNDDEDAISFTDDSILSPTEGPSLEFGQSTGGLDFISSSGYPKIEFGYGSEDESSGSYPDEEGTEEISPRNVQGAEDGNLSMRKQAASGGRYPRSTKTTLYIQMEYCERQTLRDLLRQGIYHNVDDCWRLFRQILEGLSHIHGHGIIHRDLKPDNIFIDVANNPRIGDFGLATSGQYFLADRTSSGNVDGDMTRSIGTALYVAPELKSSASGYYTEKVDMYSLGIIFFEMCYPLKTAMERDRVIRELREKEHVLPPEFHTPDMALQGSIIKSLISHRPSERPSSIELLQGGKLPLQVEDETVRLAIQGLADSNSPYFQKMMSALFSQPAKQIKDYAWDMGSTTNYGTNELLLQGMVKDKLTSIFRRHGAVEVQRPVLFPRSDYYTSNVAQLLDSSGTLLQLPYDLTLPNARAVARQMPSAQKSFAFGNVYRDLYTGGQPRSHREVDFDIVSPDTLDLALKEAEVIKVIDEVVDAFPSLKTTQMCFHVNHADLLELIMSFCRITLPQRPSVKEVLSKLNIGQWTWQKIRNELRSPALGVPSTSLDDLERFDFRDTPEKAFARLRTIFEGTDTLDKTSSIFAHITAVTSYLKHFNVQRKVYLSPLSSFNDRFYKGGILFQCLYDTKRKDVFAAGGRYDSLIQDHRPKLQGVHHDCHAVGFNLGWEKLFTSMARFQKQTPKHFLKKHEEPAGQGEWATRRCDVLIASFDPAILRTDGIKLVQYLWHHEISAELAIDTRQPDELLSHYRDDKHSWIVIIKQDTGGFSERSLKVRSMVRKEDTDIRKSDLMSYLRTEIRERDHREGTNERAKLLKYHNPQEAQPHSSEKEGDVRVLMYSHKSKKSNRRNVIEAAQSRTHELVNSFLDGPILAIEIRDEFLDAIRDTRLSDPESWRRVIQSAPVAERKYLAQMHEVIGDMAKEMKGVTRNAFIYNFRTGSCIYYDLGRSS